MTVSGKARRNCAAPCTSMSMITFFPAASTLVTSERSVPYHMPCTCALSANASAPRRSANSAADRK